MSCYNIIIWLLITSPLQCTLCCPQIFGGGGTSITQEHLQPKIWWVENFRINISRGRVVCLCLLCVWGSGEMLERRYALSWTMWVHLVACLFLPTFLRVVLFWNVILSFWHSCSFECQGFCGVCVCVCVLIRQLHTPACTHAWYNQRCRKMYLVTRGKLSYCYSRRN